MKMKDSRIEQNIPDFLAEVRFKHLVTFNPLVKRSTYMKAIAILEATYKQLQIMEKSAYDAARELGKTERENRRLRNEAINHAH